MMGYNLRRGHFLKRGLTPINSLWLDSNGNVSGRMESDQGNVSAAAMAASAAMSAPACVDLPRHVRPSPRACPPCQPPCQ